MLETFSNEVAGRLKTKRNEYKYSRKTDIEKFSQNRMSCSEACLEPCKTSMMELLCESSERLLRY